MTRIEIKSDEVVYFAYGTLLEMDEIHKYCPTAEALGVFRLKGFRLGFAACGPDPASGGCTLFEDPKTMMVFADAKQAVQGMLTELKEL